MSNPPLQPIPPNDAPVEQVAPEVEPEVEPRGLKPPSNPNLPDHRARTARIIAFSLIVVFVLSIIAQYTVLTILTVYKRDDAIPNFEHLFNNCFPVISGLVGSAVTYYLTKERK